MAREEMKGDGKGYMDDEERAKHFVLVHGSGHGAWCWYKLASSLRADGHRVTAVDLGGSGSDPRSIDEIGGFSEYVQPLVDVVEPVPEGEKVVLVGHSFGGFSLARAMELFPRKIEVAVFLTAFLPDTTSPPSAPLAKCFEVNSDLMDTEVTFENGFAEKLLFGPKALSALLYPLCPSEDLALALRSVRKTKLFAQELSLLPPLSKEAFGSVRKAYIVCKGDLSLTEEFQRWMIERNGPGAVDVREIDGADHMPMLSQPQQLHRCLMDIIQG